ncbi:MAG: adenylate/guanylate cyclase domain-containing protein [SAR202 cluster bacterium]|nr:adenylate/guanylate cyclase domain-containing protein [SAR202 cluster bacterium]
MHGDIEVKSMGNGFMLTFPSARRAVSAGIAILTELESPEFAESGGGISIRMGLTVGEPIREQQDLFGIAVVLASRIGAEAQAGQILTSQIVHALLGNTGEFTFLPAGEHTLKGISGLQKLYEIEWRNK